MPSAEGLEVGGAASLARSQFEHSGRSCVMSTKSRERIYSTMIRVSAERAKEARKEADRLACNGFLIGAPSPLGSARRARDSSIRIAYGDRDNAEQRTPRLVLFSAP